MAEYICTDCANYCRKKSSVKFVKNHFDERVIEAHCSKHPEVFKKWWEENKSKLRKDIIFDLDCFEPNEHLKHLNKLIDLTDKIIDKIDKYEQGEIR